MLFHVLTTVNPFSPGENLQHFIFGINGPHLCAIQHRLSIDRKTVVAFRLFQNLWPKQPTHFSVYAKLTIAAKTQFFFFFSSSSSFFSPSASVTDREGKEGRGLLSIWVVLLRFLSAECLVMLAEAKGERRESQSEEMGWKENEERFKKQRGALFSHIEANDLACTLP